MSANAASSACRARVRSAGYRGASPACSSVGPEAECLCIETSPVPLWDNTIAESKLCCRRIVTPLKGFFTFFFKSRLVCSAGPSHGLEQRPELHCEMIEHVHLSDRSLTQWMNAPMNRCAVVCLTVPNQKYQYGFPATQRNTSIWHGIIILI